MTGPSRPPAVPPTTTRRSASGRASHAARARVSFRGRGSGNPSRPTRRRAAGTLPSSRSKSRIAFSFFAWFEASDQVRPDARRVSQVVRPRGDAVLVEPHVATAAEHERALEPHVDRPYA